MLFASLICSGIMLVAAFLAARYAKNPGWVAFFWGLAVAAVPLMFLMLALPAVWLQLAILTGGLLIAERLGGSRRAIPPVAAGSFLLAYVILGVSIVGKYREYERLRAEYPFESMEERLSRPVPPSSPGDPANLTSLEWEIETNTRNREQFLAALHANSTDRFVNSAGFGVGRVVRQVTPTDAKLSPGQRPDAPQQLDYFKPAFGNEPEGGFGQPDATALSKLHNAGFLDFVNPRGFGYVKDRQHVAGFLSHGFSKVPDPAGEWKVASLELVGLLQHKNPVVYVSSKLPKMDELRDAPTRPLDAFETTALKALREGADLHTSDATGAVRFLGAIRSTKQCIACHGGDRGALLGAFTYRLTPAKN